MQYGSEVPPRSEPMIPWASTTCTSRLPTASSDCCSFEENSDRSQSDARAFSYGLSAAPTASRAPFAPPRPCGEADEVVREAARRGLPRIIRLRIEEARSILCTRGSGRVGSGA